MSCGQQLAKFVTKIATLTGEEQAKAEEDFYYVAGNKTAEFVTTEQYMKHISGLMDKRHGDNTKKKALKLKMAETTMKRRDRDGDNKVTKQEFKMTDMFEKLEFSLQEYGEDLFADFDDDVMDEGEFTTWLTEACGVTDNYKQYWEFVKSLKLKTEQGKIPLSVLTDGLFTLAYNE